MKEKIYNKIFHMLTKRQKINFIIIIIIMIISALLTQLLPLSIGRLTDDVLNQNELSFISVLPFLGFILVITVTNEIIKVIRRLLVEDTSTRFEKSARTKAILLAISFLVNLVISKPSISIFPSPFSSLLITLISEDFPQPLGPAIPINSPF